MSSTGIGFSGSPARSFDNADTDLIESIDIQENGEKLGKIERIKEQNIKLIEDRVSVMDGNELFPIGKSKMGQSPKNGIGMGQMGSVGNGEEEKGDASAGLEEARAKFGTLALEVAATDKNFQIRIFALNAIRDKLAKSSDSPSDVVFTQYNSIIKASVNEIQPKVLDAGLDCVTQYLKSAPSNSTTDESALEWAKDFIPNCILKKQAKVQELMMLIYEVLEDPSKFTFQLIFHYRKGLKAPKAVTSGYQALITCLTAFGPSICNPVGLYDLFDKGMTQPHRNGFKDVFKELYKFLGNPLADAATQTSKMPLEFREELKKDFEKLAAANMPALEPSRLTRTARLNPQVKKGGSAAFSLTVEFSKMEAINIEPKLFEAEKKANSQISEKSEHLNFFKDLSGETEESRTMKWNKKVERLTMMHDILKAAERHAVNSFYIDVVRILKKQLVDINVQVQGSTIACLTLMAKNARKDLNREAKTVFPLLLNLLKEAKPQVSKKLPDCLDMMAKYCFEVDQVLSDIQTSLNSQVVVVRDETLNYLMRWMDLSEAKSVFVKHASSIADLILPRIIDDKENSIRTTATLCMGKLMRVVGGTELLPIHFKKIEDTDKKKATKIKELVKDTESEEKIVVVDKIKPELEDTLLKPGVNKPVVAAKQAALPSSATVAPTKKQVAAPSSTAQSVGASKKTAIAVSPLDNLEIPSTSPMPVESAFEVVSGYFTEARQKILVAGKFQECSALFTEVAGELDQAGAKSWEPLTEALVIHALFGGAKKPLAKTFTVILQFIVKVASSAAFDKKLAIVVMTQVADKLADNKILSKELFFVLASHFGPKWVFYAFQSAWKQSGFKIPAAKHMTEFYVWVADSVIEFTIASYGGKWLIDCLKNEILLNPSFDVKDAALRNQIGLVFVSILKASSEAMRAPILEGLGDKAASIEKLLSQVKAEDIKPPNATRAIDGVGLLALPSQDELLPRVDVAADFEPIIKKLTDENWRVQKDGVAEVGPVLARANQRILPGSVVDLFASIKGPLLGSQKGVTLSTLTMIQDVSKALPPGGMKNSAKVMGEWMCTFLGNNDKAIRQKAIEVLNVMVKDAGLQAFVHYLVKILLLPNAREATLELIVSQTSPCKVDDVEQKAAVKEVKYDLIELVKPLVACLTDKSADIRNKAEQVVEYIATHSKNGGSAIGEEINLLPKAQQLSLQSIIDKYCKSQEASLTVTANTAKPSAKFVATSSKIPAKSVSGIKPPSSVGSGAAIAKPKNPNALDDDYILKSSDKEARLRKAVRRYNGLYEDATRVDELDALRDSLAVIMSPKLCAKLFSVEVQDQVSGLEFLHIHFAEIQHSVVYSSLDLLFKMLASRIAQQNCNPSVMHKALISLEDCLKSCQISGEHPTDFELEVIAPSVLEKCIGNNNKQIQSKAVEVVQLLSYVVPHVKLTTYLLDATRSKNYKVASSALLEVDQMLKTCVGSVDSVFGPNCKQLIKVTKSVASTDSGLRTAALTVIASVFSIIGENVWRFLGDETAMDNKVRSMIEERLKRTVLKTPNSLLVAKSADLAIEEKHVESVAATKVNNDLVETQDLNAKLAIAIPTPARIPSIGDLEMQRASLVIPAKVYPNTSMQIDTDSGVDSFNKYFKIKKLANSIKRAPLVSHKIDTYILCAHDLEAMLSMSDFEFDSDQTVAVLVVDALTMLLDFAFEDLALFQIDLINSTVSALSAFFDRRHFAHCITYMGLEPVLCSLLTHFTNSAIRSMEGGKEIISRLNNACIRLLDNSDRETSLLCLLSYASKSQGPSGTATGRFSWKFFEYTIRCILKITKQFKEMEFSNMSHVMQECERFFSIRSPQEFSDFGLKAAANPYSVIVTVVQELYKYHPIEVDDYLTISKTESLVRMVVNKQKLKSIESGQSVVEAVVPSAKVRGAVVIKSSNTETSQSAFQASLVSVDNCVDIKQKVDSLVALFSECCDGQMLHVALDKLLKLYDSCKGYVDEVCVKRLSPGKLEVVQNAIALRKLAELVSSRFLSFQQKSSFAEMVKFEYRENQTVDMVEKRSEELKAKMEAFEKDVADIRTLKPIDDNVQAPRVVLRPGTTPIRPSSAAKYDISKASGTSEIANLPEASPTINLKGVAMSSESNHQRKSVVFDELPKSLVTVPVNPVPLLVPQHPVSSTSSRLDALRSRLQSSKK